ncbi:hypothetical protein PIB30_061995 [Stylosanthes scabra]|uniref:RIN4 pathogenic type III effector avirulence factor Avr cleavage site domain-containing protein n=1 Tax=Stylosanthes scabra TaxID=79078 RepID=A0ABU6XLY5_9FABA|nr:hypothetical protein [Stylosanthes scabra]
MEEYYYKRNHVPAFGSWDWNDNLPFTECFESAREAGFLQYSYSDHHSDDVGDLYVTGDLYDNHVVTPAMIVVPRTTKAKVGDQNEKERRKKNCVRSDNETLSPTTMKRPNPKPVDEDLYKISPALLYQNTKKKRGSSFFSCCLVPTCIA